MDYAGRTYVLMGLLLFLPLLDRGWRPPATSGSRKRYLTWGALLAVFLMLLLWRPHHAGFAFITLLTAALPEEWFFRAYCLVRLGMNRRANLISSALFALLHGLVWGWATGLLVFIPSVLYGWLYLKTRDLVLIVLVHALSNLVYVMFLRDLLVRLIGGMPG